MCAYTRARCFTHIKNGDTLQKTAGTRTLDLPLPSSLPLTSGAALTCFLSVAGTISGGSERYSRRYSMPSSFKYHCICTHLFQRKVYVDVYKGTYHEEQSSLCVSFSLSSVHARARILETTSSCMHVETHIHDSHATVQCRAQHRTITHMYITADRVRVAHRQAHAFHVCVCARSKHDGTGATQRYVRSSASTRKSP